MSADNSFDFCLCFDHRPRSTLTKACDRLGIEVLPVVTEYLRREPAVVPEILSRGRRLIFVHVNDETWRSLLEKAPASSVIVRFTSDAGFPPIPPASEGPLALHCRKSISTVKVTDLVALAEVCRSEGALEQLRSGRVPAALQGLLSFAPARRLVALYIMLQGVLAAWAAGCRGPRAERALELLGTSELPGPPSGCSFTEARVLRRALGSPDDEAAWRPFLETLLGEAAQELGQEALSKGNPLRGILEEVFDVEPTKEIGADRAFAAFSYLERLFAR